jgi:hypothetical protein
MKLPNILPLTSFDRSFSRAVLMGVVAAAILALVSVEPTHAAQRRGKKGLPPPSTSHQADRREETRGRNGASDARQSASNGKKRVPSTAIAKQKSGGASSREASSQTRQRSSPPPQTSRETASREEEQVEAPLPVATPPTTDYSSARIETIEYGSAKYNQTTRQLSLPTTGRGTGGEASKGRINVSNRRIEVDIAPERVIEIQRALIERKYLEGDPTGIYDDVTIEAMRQFQTKEQIDVTGYPTAHSLKRLGLTR